MKKLLIILLFGICLTDASAQNNRVLTLPEYKESPKIDSLLNSVIPRLDHNCHYLSFNAMDTEAGNYTMSLMQLKNKESGIYYVFKMPQYMVNFAYFEYKRITVFIDGDIFTYNLFQKTDKSKVFHFIWENENVYLPNENLFFGIYEFNNGVLAPPDLSRDKPEPIEEK
jgi:hypothetical protein